MLGGECALAGDSQPQINESASEQRATSKPNILFSFDIMTAFDIIDSNLYTYPK